MTETLIAVSVIVVLVGFAIGRPRKPARPMTDEEKLEVRRQAARARAIQRVNGETRDWWM
jgi:dihydrodipicolinate synthase/N-acetylneuraminate lyase